MTNKYAFIRSVSRPSAQGRHLYRNENGQLMEKTKAMKAGTRYCFSHARNLNSINTGLHETVPNPWVDTTRSLPEGFDSDILKQKEITKQDYFEIKYNHPKGYYTSQKEKLDSGRPTAIQNFSYDLFEGMNTLNLDNERDELMLQLAYVTDKIASSKDEINTAKHSYYIAVVDEDELEEVKKYEIVEEALSLNAKIKSELPFDHLKRLAITLEFATYDINDNGVKANIYHAIADPKNKDQSTNCKNFIKLGKELFGKKEDKERFKIRYIYQMLLNYRILAIVGNKVQWVNAPSPELSTLAHSKSAGLMWLLDPNNKDHLNLMLGQLSDQTGIKIK
jgi:hypothetical protein